MKGNNFAILIGINEYNDKRHLKSLKYAEKDSQDLHNVLTDQKLSSFSPENVLVLTGAEATTRNIETALYKGVVKDRGPEDGVIVYFSGHGFIAGDRELAYLGTHDVAISDLLDNPNIGLRMDRLHDDLLMMSPAKNVLFILDCCHSGAVTPSSSRDQTRDVRRELLNREFFSGGTGRLAIVSCPPDDVCRESTNLQNGIFTHYLIRGLRGEATEQHTGEVTIDSLLAYVRSHTPSDQTPGSYGQTYGRIVLTTPSANQDLGSYRAPILKPEKTSIASATVTPLSNPLEPYIPFIERLESELIAEGSQSGTYTDNRILEVVRRASSADFVFLLRAEDDRYLIKSRSETGENRDDRPSYIENAFSRATAVVDSIMAPQRIYYNVRCPYEDTGGIEKNFIVVPVGSTESANEYLVIFGIDSGSWLLDDAYCHILSALYVASQSLTDIQPKRIKAALLDNLRKDFYGHVPLGVYETRLALFEERLRDLTVYFQPILHLVPGSLYICGWEALARDSETMLAPTDVFDAAQTWGRRFLTELDICMAQRAAERYRWALKEAKMQRPHEIQELSINAYPSSLMRTGYFESLRDSLKENSLSGKVAIEISEKDPIPDEAGDIKTYKKRLEKFVTELHIGFGIDDFGVGYSSIERLANLNPAYVKIDKEVLHLEASDHAIKFVLDVTSHGRLRPAKVVVEGFDGSGRLSLDELYNLGVHYIQGYSIGKARAELYRIRKDEASYLEGLLKAA